MTTCAKCGYRRTIDDSREAAECPHCRTPYPPSVAAKLAFGPRAIAAETARDASALAVFAANAFTIVVALWTGMELRELLLVYWAQSVFIGVSFFIRMIAIARYSTGPFGDNLHVPFFLVHYGFFHLIYWVFLRSGLPGLPPMEIGMMFWLCVACFLASHGYSLWHNISRDRVRRTDGSTLFWVPYARVVPMHLTLILGLQLPGAADALFLFLFLKTFADVLMHTVEHRILRASV